MSADTTVQPKAIAHPTDAGLYLLGHAGDAVNALLCAAGHNLRLILNRLRALFALILALLSATENRNTSRHPPIYAQT